MQTNSTSGGRLGRNDPCHCGSGRKYKLCHLAQDEREARAAREKAADEPRPAEADAEAHAARPPGRPPKREAHQPWKKGATRGFFPRARAPRRMGGS